MPEEKKAFIGEQKWIALWCATLMAIGTLSRLAPLADPHGRLLRQFMTEDGYLMQIVARNLALNLGMTVSDGTVQTNGVQPLATFIFSVFYWIAGGDKVGGVAGVQLFSVLVSLAAAYFLYKLAATILKDLPDGHLLAAMSASLWFASPLIVKHSMNGLETGLYLLVSIATLYVFAKFVERSPTQFTLGQMLWLGVMLGVCFLVRALNIARNAERLEADVTDLRVRFGREAEAREFDVLDTGSHSSFLDRLGELPDIVVSLVGLMTPQGAAQADFAAADLMIRSNFLGLVSILGEVANRMEQRGSGTIIGLSSVAGDRGRATNYVYGSAKAGFTAFLSGLRNRLFGKGVTVITVKPGFIRTRMTEGLDLPAPLTAASDEMARDIKSAHKKGRLVVYRRPVWRLIMLIIRSLPERVFVRTKF